MSQLPLLQLSQAQQDQTRLLEHRQLSLQVLPQMNLLQIYQLNHLLQLKMGLLLIHLLSLQVLNKPLQELLQLNLPKILHNQHQPKVMKKQLPRSQPRPLQVQQLQSHKHILEPQFLETLPWHLTTNLLPGQQ